MSRLIMAFIRHGEYHQLSQTPSAHQPFALTERGIQQSRIEAEKLNSLLTQNHWKVVADVDSAMMLRAWQTAEIFITHLHSKSEMVLTCYADLAERSVGAVANMTVKQIEALIDADPRYDALPEGWKSNSHFCLPFQGAESLMQAGQRVAKHIEKQMSLIARTNHTQVKLFFGHGASFRHAAFQMGILDFDKIEKLSMYYAHPLLFELLEDGQWQHIFGDWKVRQPKIDAID